MKIIETYSGCMAGKRICTVDLSDGDMRGRVDVCIDDGDFGKSYVMALANGREVYSGFDPNRGIGKLAQDEIREILDFVRGEIAIEKGKLNEIEIE